MMASYPFFVSFLHVADPVLWVRDAAENKADTVLAVTCQGGGRCTEYHTNECLSRGLQGEAGRLVSRSGEGRQFHAGNKQCQGPEVGGRGEFEESKAGPWGCSSEDKGVVLQAQPRPGGVDS